jgi:hypothetical protein
MNMIDLLTESRFLEELDIIVQAFDNSTKLRFRDPTQTMYIKFGGLKDKDLKVGIKAGQLQLSG